MVLKKPRTEANENVPSGRNKRKERIANERQAVPARCVVRPEDRWCAHSAPSSGVDGQRDLAFAVGQSGGRVRAAGWVSGAAVVPAGTRTGKDPRRASARQPGLEGGNPVTAQVVIAVAVGLAASAEDL